MKRITKLNCSCISIAALLLSIFFQSTRNVKYNSAPDCIDIDKNDVLLFVQNNLSNVALEYNKKYGDDWEPSYVENSFEININDCGRDTDGFFLDFDSDNGYAVVGDNYTLYDFQTSGASPFANISSNSYLYSSSYGYFYFVGDEYLSVKDVNNQNINLLNNQPAGEHYAGQPDGSSGCGDIDSPRDYVYDKYGSGWALDKHKSLKMDGYLQYGLSCYFKHKIEKNKTTGAESVETYSEGNCWFISALNVLRYMQQTKWTRMPSKSMTLPYTPSFAEPNLYSKFYDESGNNKTKKLYYNNGASWVYERFVGQSTFTFERLYIDIRNLINEKYKKVDGGIINETSAIIERIAKKYDYTVNAQEYSAWSSHVDEVANKIDSSIPSLWSTSCDTYGSHTMAVCGYRYYTRTTGWWVFQKKETKVLFEIRDGWSNEPKFFDMSGYQGFAALVTLNF